jgi:hypothetical protein
MRNVFEHFAVAAFVTETHNYKSPRARFSILTRFRIAIECALARHCGFPVTDVRKSEQPHFIELITADAIQQIVLFDQRGVIVIFFIGIVKPGARVIRSDVLLRLITESVNVFWKLIDQDAIDDLIIHQAAATIANVVNVSLRERVWIEPAQFLVQASPGRGIHNWIVDHDQHARRKRHKFTVVYRRRGRFAAAQQAREQFEQSGKK